MNLKDKLFLFGVVLFLSMFNILPDYAWWIKIPISGVLGWWLGRVVIDVDKAIEYKIKSMIYFNKD